MKMNLASKLARLAAGVVFAAAVHASTAFAGYVNHAFPSNFSLFGNPLNAADNHLNAIIPAAPDGSIVSLWNTSLGQFTPAATFSAGSWDNNLLLAPGTGALMYNPAAIYINTFVGNVVDADGGPFDFDAGVHLPPAAPPFNGFYLVSSRIPFSGSSFGGHPLFELIFGRAPEDWVGFMRWNVATQDYTQPLWFVAGDWYDNTLTSLMAPALNVGEAGFFFLGGNGNFPVVPEPGSLTILGVGLMAYIVARRQRC